MWCITKSWGHVLVVIVILEFFRVKGFLLCRRLVGGFLRSSLIFFFVVLIVCEACLGMCLVVCLGRARGGEVQVV